jgi:hypothetical protein
MAPLRKYVALDRYLESLPADQQAVLLTFDELEQLVGHPLPASALISYFWAGSYVARWNWEWSGFKARLNQNARAVEFSRRPLKGSGPQD